MKIRFCLSEQKKGDSKNNTVCRITVFFIIFCVISTFLACQIYMGGSSSKSDMAAPIIVRETEKHIATLIFLHGLGDTGHGWADAFKQLKLKNIRCVCPTAPVMPVTLNAGYRMPSWFDLISLSPDGPEDEAGIKKASEMLKELISAQEVPTDKVILGGFSQGGALALYTALTMDKPVAGIVGLSTWMPLHKKVAEGMKVNRDIPMFQGHGTIDPLVSPVFGELTARLIQTMSSKHTFKTYPIMHTSCPEEMEDVKTFLQDLVKE